MTDPRDDLALFRIYEPYELKGGRYPNAWDYVPCPHDNDGDGDCGRRGCPYCDGDGSVRTGIKHIVRELSGHRCVRCLHPYRAGSGVWGEDPGNPEGPPSMLLGLIEDDRALDTEYQIKSRPPLWSDCDEACRHGGPMRAMTTEGWRPFDPEPDACGAAVHVLGPGNAQAAWRILTVHHLNERKEDCRWHNLVPLCQRCHLNIQRRVKMDKPFPWPHSEWFHPYVAAHYAAKYGANPAPTYSWTMAHLRELLELGQREEAVERMPV